MGHVSVAQLSSEFTLPKNEFCLQETISILNSSNDAVAYEWDFSVGELDSVPTLATSVSSVGVTTVFGLKLINDDGDLHAFVPGRSSSTLVRLDYGSSLDGTPSENDITAVDGELDQPNGITFIRDSSDVWYGFVINGGASGNGSITRLKFSSGITNQPEVADLGDFSGSINSPEGIEVVNDGQNYTLMIMDEGELLIIDLGASLEGAGSVLASTSVSGASRLWDISTLKADGVWYGLMTDFNSGKVYHVNFGATITSTFTVTDLGLTIASAVDNELMVDGGRYYGIVGSRANGLYRLEFGNSLVDTDVDQTALGKLDQLASNTGGVSILYNESDWFGIISDFSLNRIFSIDFPDESVIDNPFSTDFEPSNISYSAGGEFIIGLTAIDEDGERRTSRDTVEVISSVAPDISFSINDARCLGAINTFTADPATGLTYSWDFDGDDTEDATTGTEDFTYGASGTYAASLTVSDGTCSNQQVQEITILEAPVAAFNISGTLCTNTELTFDNTSTPSGSDTDQVSFDWDFGDGETSDLEDPTHQYTATGSPTVTLTVSIPGCSDEATEDIVLNEGPEVGFSYLNNCLGEEVDFTSEITGSFTSINWDLGDGTLSTLASPSHTYAALADTFLVSLTVENALGCQTVITDSLLVNDEDLVSFNIASEGERNVVIPFSGVDETLSRDVIESWTWTFDTEGSSNDQNTTFSFDEDGTYTITLSGTSEQGCESSVQETITIVEPELPSPGFTISESVCRDQSVTISNTSVNAISYEWDFSVGELEDDPTVVTSTTVARSFGVEIVNEEGQLYGFVPARDANQLVRLTYGSSLDGTTAEDELTTVSSALNRPWDVAMLKDSSDVWHGFVINEVNGGFGTVTRVTFGDGLDSEPTQVDDLGDYSGGLDTPETIEVLNDGKSYFLLIGDQDKLVIVDLGVDPGTGTGSIISSASIGTRFWDISVIKSSGRWYGLLTDFGDADYLHIDFGEEITATYTTTPLTTSNITDPVAGELIEESGLIYAFAFSRTNGLYRISFDILSDTDIDTPVEIGTLGVLGSNGGGISMTSNGSTWYGLLTDFITNEVYTMNFTDDVEVSTAFSTDFEPANISYSAGGEFIVGLTAIDEDGDRVSVLDTVTVLSATAPAIDFSIDDTRCEGVDVNFTANPSSGLTYSWDFDGDNSEDATSGEASFSFAAAGDYTTTLTVSDGSCTNAVSQDITILEVPVASFDISGTLCTNTEVSFSNTSTPSSSDTDLVSFDWDFGDGETSDLEDPTHEYTATGSPTVTLTVSIPGCSDEATEDIVLNEGPEVGFSYLNNCLGEEVDFTSEITGSFTSINWDLGDGTLSTLASPSHTYAAVADTFLVSLTVENAIGCQTVVTDSLLVNDEDLVSFNIASEAERNEVITFSGVDETLSRDAIESWTWTFDTEGSSNDQNTTFSFDEDGTYTITLSGTSEQGCESSVQETITIVEPELPSPGFTISESVCRDQSVTISNTSVNAISYEWDFSVGELEDDPTVVTSTTVARSFGVEIVNEEGQLYGFVPARDANQLVRLTYGSSLDGTTAEDELTTVSSALNRPWDVAMLKDSSDVWHGFVINEVDGGFGTVTRVTFGDGLDSEPTQVDDLGDYSGGLDTPETIEVLNDGKSYFLLIGDQDKLVIVDLGVDPGTGTGSIISSASIGTRFWDISVIKSSGRWYGLLTDFGDADYLHIDFGEEITATYTTTPLTTSNITDPVAGELIEESGLVYAFALSQTNGLYRISFDILSDTDIDTPVEIGTLGVLGSNGGGISMTSNGSTWYGLLTDFITNEVYTMNFTDDVEVSTAFSTDFEPSNISYSAGGEFIVGLTAIDEDGDRVSVLDTVTVLSATAPAIDFSIDDTRCEGVDVNFTANPSSGLTYSWDFDGDNSEDATSGEASFSFAAAGDYTTTLTVSDGSCTNAVSQDITILEVPVASFDISGTLCTNTEVSFSNTSTPSSSDTDLVSFDWDFGDGETSDLEDPTHEYTATGSPTVTLTVSIPGCSDEATEDIVLNEGPEVGFSYLNNCLGEEVDFTSEITGSFTSINWDLGDGTLSTLASPSHTYAAVADTFLVSLTVENAIGCQTVVTDSLLVNDEDLVSFNIASEAERNEVITFSGVDETLSRDAIESWTWTFDTEGSSNDQNTTFSFDEDGTYTITLSGTSEQGCESSVQETITIVEPELPSPGFTISESVCQDQSVTISNTSVNATSYEWDFSVGELEDDPTVVASTTVERSFGVEIVNEEGQLYGFVPARDANQLVRLTYGSSLDGTTAEDELTTVSSALNRPWDVAMLKDSSDVWHGFVINEVDGGFGTVTRVTFGDGLDSEPTQVDDLGDYSGGLDTPETIEVLNDGKSYFLLIGDQDKLVIVDFGVDPGTGTGSIISSASIGTRFWDISVIKSSGRWYGLLTDFGDADYLHIDFGEEITATYTTTPLTTSNITDPVAGELIEESGLVYAFALSQTNGLYRISFDILSDTDIDTPVEIGTLGVLGSNGGGISMTSNGSTWYGLLTDFITNEVYTMNFTDDVEVSTAFSTVFEPGSISYGAEGSFIVGLTAIDEDGDRVSVLDTVTVLSATAPAIDFSIDDTRCEGVDVNFTANPSSGLTYSWDFDGDNSEDATSGEASFSFAAAGDYTTTLTVSDGSCTNAVSQDITILEVPVASFDISGTLCTNTEVSFSNTSTPSSSDTDLVSFDWDFGDGETSDLEDPTHEYTATGSPTVTLTVSIPGCSDEATEDIVLNEGPEVGFSYLNNCLGEEVDFTSEITGSFTSINWDLGDGTLSTLASPSHTYAAVADTFLVSLTVENAIGCQAVVTDSLLVNDEDLVSFNIASEAERNEVITFSGVDETLSRDAIESWTWTFDTEGSSNDQNTTFSFDEDGTYTITLLGTSEQGCVSSVDRVLSVVAPALPRAAFNANTSVCIGEFIVLENTSVNALTYEWDFSIGDLEEAPSFAASSSVTRAFGVELVLDEELLYGFVPSRDDNQIIRLNYGDSLNEVESSNELRLISSELDRPWDIAMQQDSSDIWHAFIINEVSEGFGRVVRATFGDGLSEEPTRVDDLGNYSEGLDTPETIEVLNDGTSYFLLIGDQDKLVIVDLGVDLGTGSGSIISSASIGTRFWDISVIKSLGNWYALLTDFGDENLIHVDFGEQISDTYTLTTLTAEVVEPVAAELVEESGAFYGFALSRTGGLYRLNFDALADAAITSSDSLGTQDVLGTDASGISMVSDNSVWYGLVTDFLADQVYTMNFTEATDVTLFFSTDFETSQVAYDVAGEYEIGLTAIDADGDRVSVRETIRVISTVAPDISFDIDASRCIDNTNTFTANPSSGLIYTWDFNGEGSGTEAEETFQFTSPGEKQIDLTVNDGTCTNSIQETITMYEAPPSPVFDLGALTCERTSLTITNNTVDDDWSNTIAYTWTFGEDSTVTANQPDYAFTSSGEQVISVFSSIPGCVSATVTDTIAVNESPVMDYSISPTCDQEVTNFTNLTSGATSYSWDFGDGFTSTQESPTHLYQEPGDYTVSMVAANSVGCTDTLVQAFSVDYLPVAGFRAQLPCEGLINIVDTSSVAASDIVAWSYSIGGSEELFADQNPTLTLSVAGDYEVTQEVTSTAGCRSSTTQSISVQDAAEAAMQISDACFGESFQFTDVSSVNADNQVISRVWSLEGQDFVVDPGVVEFEYNFLQPGTYDVVLTLTTQNLCTSTSTRSLEVLAPPVLAFDVPDICQNDFATFTDLSTGENNPIVSRQWILNDALIGNGPSVSHKFTVDGINVISLVTTTAQGCQDTLTRNVDVVSAPEASFDASSAFGVEGSEFSFNNTSSGSSTYQWVVDGTPVSTTTDLDTTFDVSGNREVLLIATSDFACSDTTAMDVLVRVPEIDVVLSGMRLAPDPDDPNFSVIQVSVENQSNLPVDALRFVVEIDDQLPVQNTVDRLIPIGEPRSIELEVGVPNQARYLCVQVFSTYDSQDINSEDNSRCINIDPQPVFPPLYPNPARNEVIVDTVLPAEGDVTISLLDVSGKVEVQETYPDVTEGLQSFRVELAPYDPGLYFIKIEYDGITEIKRIVKQ